MIRPTLIHFLAIASEHHIVVKALLSSQGGLKSPWSGPQGQVAQVLESTPFEHIALLRGKRFRLKVIALNEHHQNVFSKVYESDAVGNFWFKIPLIVGHGENRQKLTINYLQLFEVSMYERLELEVGTIIPIRLSTPNNVIISDFDKTLVDTKYHTIQELYQSLSKPLSFFPAITYSIDLLKQYIQQNFTPFILSASPHFYENAIRDWLYQNQIYSSGIFLKDYRHIFSFVEGELSPKDIKGHGFYKLQSLLKILLMTELPQELVLMGDSFESDTNIYLALSKFLNGNNQPHMLWNKLKGHKVFNFSRKQNTQILSSLYQVETLLKSQPIRPKVRIYIRCKERLQSEQPIIPFLQEELSKVTFYPT